ncbi:CAP domain-containing protein, partial [Oscillospiraceae bacterium 50-16]
MKDFASRLTAGIACAALVFGLTLPANAAAAAETIRVGSYKGNSLDVGERSGLIIGPSGTEYTVTSSAPDTVAVEQIAGFWVAVAKSEGTAEITASNRARESGTLTLTVGTAVDPAASASTDTEGQPENLDVRQELIQLINQTR